MTDQLPDFEQTHPEPTFEDPKPKKPRRKPAKRKAKRVSFLERKAQLAAPKKRKVAKRKRRGRPVGALNKPKVDEQHAGGRLTPELYRLIGTLLGLTAFDRAFVLSVVARLAK